jgi:hypothetical protein
VVEEEVLSQGSPLKKDSRHSSSFRPILSPKKRQASNDRMAEFEEEEEEVDDEEGADPMAVIPAAEYSINEVMTFLSMQERQGKSTFTLQDLLSLQPNKSQRKEYSRKSNVSPDF